MPLKSKLGKLKLNASVDLTTINTNTNTNIIAAFSCCKGSLDLIYMMQVDDSPLTITISKSSSMRLAGG